MAKINFSSPLQLASCWDSDPELIANKIVERYQRGPKYSYALIRKLMPDIIKFNITLGNILESINRYGGTDDNKKILREIAPCISKYYKEIDRDHCILIQDHSFPLWAGMHIPFDARVGYVRSGELIIPWNLLWKNNCLTDFQMSIFKSICLQTMQKSSDLETARLDIVDFSQPKGELSRRARSVDEDSARTLSHAEIREVSDAIRKGVELAQKELDGRPASSRGDRKDRPDGLGDQPSLDF